MEKRHAVQPSVVNLFSRGGGSPNTNSERWVLVSQEMLHDTKKGRHCGML